jgi:Flp pilus assembly pilin Flp
MFAQEKGTTMIITKLWKDEQGQDIAEYAVMLAVILVIVVGTTHVTEAKSELSYATK